MMKVLIIHNRERTDRFAHITAELKRYNIDDYHFIDAVMHENPATGIAEAHKNCIRYAMLQGWDKVTVMEDDCMFTHDYGWLHYQKFLKHLDIISDFDVFLGGVYTGKVSEIDGFDIATVKEFSSTHLLTYHKRFFEIVLACPEGTHIDRWISDNAMMALLCYPMVALQIPGYSDQKKAFTDHNHLLEKHGLEILK